MKTSLLGVSAILISSAWMHLDGILSEPSPIAFCLLIVTGIACAVPALGIGAALGEGLSILAVQAVIQVPLTVITAHVHRLPALASIMAVLLGCLGLQAGADGQGSLIIDTDSGAQAIAPTFELSALPTALRILAAFVVLRGFEGIPATILRLSAYTIIRLVVLVASIVGGVEISLWSEPSFILLSFLPFAVLMTPPGRLAARRHTGRIPRVALTLAAIGGIALGLACGLRSPGKLKGGRILIDESRSDWGWTGPAFEHGRYGQRSLYSYSLWAEWIRLHYDLRITATTPSDEELESTDVLIIKTPTRPYEQASIASIERFVAGGGGLLLIGDHTNLFGMSAVLNAIAKPYGMAFRYDDTFPLEKGGLDIYRPSRLNPHPVVRGIDRYPFETSCTLRVPWGADHIMLGKRLGSEPVDYGHVNFFGNINLDSSDTFGIFVQAASVRHGAGRVAAFTDSTNFSNFSVLWPGRRRLTLNLIDWLNREVPPHLTGSALLAVGLVCLLIAPGLGVRSHGARAAVLWTGAGLFLIATLLSARWSMAAHPDPVLRGEHRTIAFDEDVGELNLEVASPVLPRGRPGWRSFNDLFINTARTGYWPVRTRELTQALEQHGVVVIVNPGRSLTRLEIEAVAGFLQRGGRLLVLDSVLNAGSDRVSLLSPFGLSTGQSLQGGGENDESRLMTPVIRLSGPGESVNRIMPGGMKVIWSQVGPGRIMLAADSAAWSDRAVGGVYRAPDERRLEIYGGQRDVFRILLEDDGGEEAGR